jgi:oligosaccharide repeat unit polymerase
MSAASILVAGLGIVLALPLVVRGLRGRFDPFEPIVVFALAYGVMFVARPAEMLLNGDLSYYGVDVRSTISRMLALALVGGVAFVCGYELTAGRALARVLPRPREISTSAGIAGSAIMIALALVALFVMLWPAGGSKRFTILLEGQSWQTMHLVSAKGSYPLMIAMLVAPAAILLLALGLRERRVGLLVAAAVTAALALVLTVPLGARAFVLPLVGGCVTFLYVRRAARPRIPTVVALVLLAFVASYALITVREPARRAHLDYYVKQFADSPWIAFSPVTKGEDANMAPVLAGALRVIPSSLGYRYGGAFFGDLALRPIPRPLWPGKPQPPRLDVVRAVWPDLAKDGFQPQFSPLLVFYWDFGIAGVAAGMALFGVACRTLYEWFLRHRSNLAAQLIFSISLWLVAAGARNDPIETIVFACVLVLPLIVVERLSGFRRAAASPVGAQARLSEK